jgi:hypothetical protein
MRYVVYRARAIAITPVKSVSDCLERRGPGEGVLAAQYSTNPSNAHGRKSVESGF